MGRSQSKSLEQPQGRDAQQKLPVPDANASALLDGFVSRFRAALLHKFPAMMRVTRQRLYNAAALPPQESSSCPDHSQSLSVSMNPATNSTQEEASQNGTLRNSSCSKPGASGQVIKGQPRAGSRHKLREYFDPRVLEKYEIKALVGKGSFSRVVRAVDRTTRRECAVKVIEARVLASKAMENELAILARLSHPCVISLVEIFHSSRRVYMVMELATGGELYDKIIERGAFPEPETASLLKMILDGLAYLHSSGITHRDLKPENLLFASKHARSRLLITDFGLAHLRQPDADPLMATTCGTPEYIAPEVLMRVPYDNKVDCWAVGVIAYILLSGIMPFDDDNRTRLYVDIIRGRYKFYREARSFCIIVGIS